MDEAERQRTTRDAKTQASKRQHSSRFGLLSYLASQGYVIGRDDVQEPKQPSAEHRRPATDTTADLAAARQPGHAAAA